MSLDMPSDKTEAFGKAEQEFSLSSALQAVSQQGECQAFELKEKQHVLCTVQATLSEAVKSYEAVANDIKLKEQQITGTIYETEQIHNYNETLETKIKVILLENMKLKHDIEEHLETTHLLLAGFNAYHNKIESYKSAMSEMESQAPIHKEMITKWEEVKKLKECREELRMDLQNPQGNTIRQAQKEIDNIKGQIHCTKELVKEKRIFLENEKETHAQLRKDIEIHNKRREAIVKRLRCQLNKAQSNHRQLRSDIMDMEKEVENLKNQL